MQKHTAKRNATHNAKQHAVTQSKTAMHNITQHTFYHTGVAIGSNVPTMRSFITTANAYVVVE